MVFLSIQIILLTLFLSTISREDENSYCEIAAILISLLVRVNVLVERNEDKGHKQENFGN